MHVLFLSFAPLHKMHFTDMYINDISKVFSTDIWDISMLGGERDRKNEEFPDIRRIRDLSEFTSSLDALKEEHKDIAVISNILIYHLHLIYHELHRRNIPVIHIDKESIIFWMRDNYLKRHPDQIPENEKSKYFWTGNRLTAMAYHYLENQHVKFDYLLGARNYFPDSAKHFVHIHNLKYDEYLRSTKEAPVLENEYILFMDAGMAHLPSLSGKADSVDQDEYLRRMNHLFDRLEDQYGIPVVIAAHPKSEYPENAFGNRQVILYKTAALARYARFVLAHYSTSLIDLVLQRKPIVFMYAPEYFQSASRTITITTAEYAYMLNAPLIDISKDDSLDIHMDEEAYARFEEDHILNADHRDTPNADLIISFLKELAR